MYICASVDELTNQCILWSEYFGLLPPLSVTEAFQIASAAFAVWGLCWGIKHIVSAIINR